MKTITVKMLERFAAVTDMCMLLLFRVFPIRKKRIFMESEGDFTDNVRVFYDWLIENRYNELYEIIWMVHEPSRYDSPPNVRFISRFHKGLRLKANYYAATSQFLFFTHPYWIRIWRKNQYVVNTTHSAAQLKAEGNPKRKLSDYVLCCSEYCKRIKAKVFKIDDKNILILGMPRIDLMFQHIECFPLLYPEKEAYWGRKKLILSMETFKQNKNMMDSENTDGFAINVAHSEKEIQNLDGFLETCNTIMIVKIHHLQDLSFLRRVQLKNILYITDDFLQQAGVQVNQLLENADVLLTDYSSVFYDYLLKDRPIGFTIGDMESYKRGFIMENPLDEMPGAKLKNLHDLKEFIKDSLYGKDEYREARKEIREKVFQYQDAHNCERLYEWMIRQLDDEKQT